MPSSALTVLDGICVLVIDDDPDTRAIITATLHHAGATMTSSAAGDHALDDLTQFRPDLIICDLQMPRLSGLEFVQRLRARSKEEGGDIPVIAITAHREGWGDIQGRGFDFAACLLKPLNLDLLCELTATFGRRGA